MIYNASCYDIQAHELSCIPHYHHQHHCRRHRAVHIFWIPVVLRHFFITSNGAGDLSHDAANLFIYIFSFFLSHFFLLSKALCVWKNVV